MKLSTSLITITLLSCSSMYGMHETGLRERRPSAMQSPEALAHEEAVRAFEALPPVTQQNLREHCRQIEQTGRCQNCVRVYLAREREEEMQDRCPIGAKMCCSVVAFLGIAALAVLYQAPTPRD